MRERSLQSLIAPRATGACQRELPSLSGWRLRLALGGVRCRLLTNRRNHDLSDLRDRNLVVQRRGLCPEDG